MGILKISSLQELRRGPSGPLIEAAIYGLAAGLSVVAFEESIKEFYQLTLVRFSSLSTSAFLLLSFIEIVGTSLIAGVLLFKYAPETAGSGIPQLKAAYWRDFGYLPWRVVWVKFVAGVITVGGGSSLGREGPSVHLAGAFASNIAGLLGTAKSGRRRAAAAGAAAGLAAAFNTPLSAVAFVLEEILGDLNSPILGSVVVAAVVGALVVHAFVGTHPAFLLPPTENATWMGNALVPVVALLAGVVGVLFQRGALGLKKLFKTTFLRNIPGWARPATGAIFAWLAAITIFIQYRRLGVFSLGYDDLMDGFGGKLAGTLPIALLLAKFAATIFSYGSGGCGGIFAQSLFFGAMIGCSVDFLGSAAGIMLNGDDRLLLMTIGMSACLGAVVRAPVTSILIVFEMTRQFSLIPDLLVAGILSQSVSRWLVPYGFYEQVLENDGVNLKTVKPPRDFREWQRYPVSAIANFDPHVLASREPVKLQEFLEANPHSRVIIQEPEKEPILVLRSEAVESLATGRSFKPKPVPTCVRSQLISEVQMQLVESKDGIVLILDRVGGRVIGLLTLHDLLRAQQGFSEKQM